MNTLCRQYKEVLDYSISQHGYWLVNHSEAVESKIKSDIVKYGKNKTMEFTDRDDYTKMLYKMIEAVKCTHNN